MNKLLGTFQLNNNIPVHKWYPYIAGFSAKFVRKELNRCEINKNFLVLDPFAGVGTTLVVAKYNNINSIGVEINPFASFVAETKLFWDYDVHELIKKVKYFSREIMKDNFTSKAEYPDIIHKAFSPKILHKLENIKQKIKKIEDKHTKDLFTLALVRILRDVSNCKNFAPYFQLNDTKLNDADVYGIFIDNLNRMVEDLFFLPKVDAFAKMYTDDARNMEFIGNETVNAVITSPPYLNNWDYSYITRIELYFLRYFEDIDEITEKLKKKLVNSSNFVLHNVEEDIEPMVGDKSINRELSILQDKLKKVSDGKTLDYDRMVIGYFNDMYQALSELYRVMKFRGNASIVLGDSCLYGVHVPTDKILAKIGYSLGFETDIETIRKRKATRHDTELVESNVRMLKNS